MYQFNYVRPKSLAEAEALLAKADDPKLLAGGQTLIPTLKQRLAMPSDLIDIGGLKELDFIRAEGNAVMIGAATKHATVAQSPDVKKHSPALAALAEGIGDPAVRHMGTIGGSIANNDPASDYPAACLALDAKIHTTKRLIEADEFFKGMFETALEDGEIVKEITFPHPEKAAYMKFPNPASRYAMVGVFVSKGPWGIRVAVTGAGQDGVFRVKEMEDALTKSWSPDAVAGIKVPAKGLNADLHGTAEYRAHLITVMAKRAVAAAG
ncbi:xanthine dehydrogenase family protein subunit M [Parvibaculum sp.]|uniref:FAD binding domain-containing protein n=1 Tax=Parvibaculum sp. TaxID=2024848 RepID=UPI001DBB1CAF|nr:xanthine dehydrogenase family protein subunit M [Parvibaculum sp.]MBX3488045.1 xanthine dehydrogenase family protein subunit M [Parvibaculum sp.]MCW5727976.1 xanthine dehydrogenase family protein subunit M [Parvibaculum sp.]